ncbi:MAG: hypothetical protein R3291_04560, partial [Thermoplasmata archaeon]|nr:hypothetical protein [Thermoplasmata archaeon]
MEDLQGIYVPSPESFTIREVHVDHALRKDPLPWLDYSFNPYVGCYHGCVFCYTPRLLQVDRGEWGRSVIVKRNAAAALARDVRKLPRGLVAISTATDPYQYVEGKYRITRHSLEVLLRADWPVAMLTRSPLIARDADLFVRFREIEVGMSVPTLDDREGDRVVDQEHPEDQREQAERGQVHVEGVDHAGEGLGARAGLCERGAWRQKSTDAIDELVDVGPVREQQVDARESADCAEHFLGTGDVHEEDVGEAGTSQAIHRLQ